MRIALNQYKQRFRDTNQSYRFSSSFENNAILTMDNIYRVLVFVYWASRERSAITNPSSVVYSPSMPNMFALLSSQTNSLHKTWLSINKSVTNLVALPPTWLRVRDHENVVRSCLKTGNIVCQQRRIAGEKCHNVVAQNIKISFWCPFTICYLKYGRIHDCHFAVF